jgi:hypothetical protein
MRGFAFVAAVSMCAAFGCSGGGSAEAGTRHITRADYGDEWPLTVESGTLSCQPGGAIVFTAEDGTAYGVNGLAADFAEIDSIWADNPSGVTPKLNIGPLIEDGQELCDG